MTTNDHLAIQSRIVFMVELVRLFEQWADELDIPMQEVLWVIAISHAEISGKPHSISSLASEMRASLATTSRLIDRMIQKNIVVKNYTGSRGSRTVLSISPQSRATHSDRVLTAGVKFADAIRRLPEFLSETEN